MRGGILSKKAHLKDATSLRTSLVRHNNFDELFAMLNNCVTYCKRAFNGPCTACCYSYVRTYCTLAWVEVERPKLSIYILSNCEKVRSKRGERERKFERLKARPPPPLLLTFTRYSTFLPSSSLSPQNCTSLTSKAALTDFSIHY